MGFSSQRLSPPLTQTCFQQGPFAPRALPRFLATMGLSDALQDRRPGYVFPWRVGGFRSHPVGPPRLLGCSFHARCPQLPREARWLPLPVASPPVAGFILVGGLTASTFLTRPNRVHLRYGSRVCLPSRPVPLLEPLLVRLHVEQAIYMVNSFQFTRPTRITLVTDRQGADVRLRGKWGARRR